MSGSEQGALVALLVLLPVRIPVARASEMVSEHSRFFVVLIAFKIILFIGSRSRVLETVVMVLVVVVIVAEASAAAAAAVVLVVVVEATAAVKSVAAATVAIAWNP